MVGDATAPDLELCLQIWWRRLIHGYKTTQQKADIDSDGQVATATKLEKK